MKIIRSIILLLGCLQISVGSLNILQLVAWMTMIHDYSQDRTIEEATEMTFSGEHPCQMCHAIADAKIEEAKKNQSPLQTPDEDRSLLRLDFQPLSETKLVSIADQRSEIAGPRAGSREIHFSSYLESVPTPPPRAHA
ncbi:MAG: hypothetical protein ACON38_09520 [Akkermansiaceae bacterium]